ncbi:hypothetical protein PTNB85_10188 [Pyrenophora teres f. teres]|uniref:DUF3328 domain containing protein n=1 Tax=Pyrenophora teres f. teres TaxID=97479 RepID=A0A6S6WI37_9PLEO|nr:hypothetical protein PTNB85_10188 [Pyrenophora teres f. teres]KAE8854301.1 hypothetical protein PTNB29_09657 [Pyrenophora teres f. teres]CAE7220771.1 DUF3328 domain containing protein [Pyrenophora teres f. teres]
MTPLSYSDNADWTESFRSINSPKSQWKRWTIINLLILIGFTIVNVALWSSRSLDSWETDFADARQSVEYHQLTYTGALRYDSASGHVIRTPDSDVEYFGPPSAEIEQAWKKLLYNEFPTMTKDEAARFEPELRPLPEDGEFHFEPDVYHSLHCINALRQMLVPVLYNQSSTMDHRINDSLNDPNWTATHTEHCLDQLRQSVMCHGDLTPSPLYVWPKAPVFLGISSTHTCRKFESIQSWMNRRAANGKSLQS